MWPGLETFVAGLRQPLEKCIQIASPATAPERPRVARIERRLDRNRASIDRVSGADAVKTWYRADALFLYRDESARSVAFHEDSVDEATAAAAALWLDRAGLSQPVWGSASLTQGGHNVADDKSAGRLEASGVADTNGGAGRPGRGSVAAFYSVSSSTSLYQLA